MTDPADLAHSIVRKVIAKGSAKTGSNENWRKDPQDYHLDRAMRHISTFKLIRDGNQPADQDKHLELALTRIAMALTQ